MNLRRFVAYSLALFAFLFVIGALHGCFSESKQVAADASYEVQQMACVDKYDTRADIDRCRQGVKLAWTVDAGKDASHE